MPNVPTLSVVIGNMVRATGSFRDEDRVLADPSGIIAIVLEPDAVTETTYTYGTDPQLTRDDVGVYVLELLLDQAGQWVIRFEGSGDVTATAEVKVMVPDSPFAAP